MGTRKVPFPFPFFLWLKGGGGGMEGAEIILSLAPPAPVGSTPLANPFLLPSLPQTHSLPQLTLEPRWGGKG